MNCTDINNSYEQRVLNSVKFVILGSQFDINKN
jgi:hypothetical protein